MTRQRKGRRSARRRVGKVSYYSHHGGWWVYYREGSKPVRRRVGDTEAQAERIAAQVNAQLVSRSPTLLEFEPISVPELRERFLAHHEDVLRSTIGTVRRYRAATLHLVEFVLENGRSLPAHQIEVERFAGWLRSRKVSPNGHENTRRRELRDKGVRFVLEVCRSMYGFAARMRHLPPYAPNPFSNLRVDRMRVEDAKPIFVFDAATELAFFEGADDWEFAVHFTLAKTGLRPGELTHLLIEDLDLDGGWLHVRNKPELGWRIKTGCQRSVPLVPELVRILGAVIGDRSVGPVFLRRRFVSGNLPSVRQNRVGMAKVVEQRVAGEEGKLGRPLDRATRAKIAQTVWRDAGAVKVDYIRSTLMRLTKKIGHPEATCPKSWRHTFATLLQDANVDPLVRQITLGHKPSNTGGALGMTATYTHTRPETQKAEIERALGLWPKSLELARAMTQGDEGCTTTFR